MTLEIEATHFTRFRFLGPTRNNHKVIHVSAEGPKRGVRQRTTSQEPTRTFLHHPTFVCPCATTSPARSRPRSQIISIKVDFYFTQPIDPVAKAIFKGPIFYPWKFRQSELRIHSKELKIILPFPRITSFFPPVKTTTNGGE